MQKIHANKLYANLGHPVESSMRIPTKYLHYIIKGMLEVSEDCNMEKRKHKSLHKVLEEQYLKPVEMIYIGISSQKKPGYGGSKDWILLQDSDSEQKWVYFKKAKEVYTEKVTPFLKKMNTTKKR